MRPKEKDTSLVIIDELHQMRQRTETILFKSNTYKSNTIYCHGPLLHTVQMAALYQDSKTFVDLKMKFKANETMAKFYEFMQNHAMVPDRMALEIFVNNNFEPAGSEFEAWIPDDWVEKPRFLNKRVKDPAFRDWGYKLNGLWKLLGRKLKEDIYRKKDMYSIIWVPRPVIVPGGRFREFYYWDSYWIMKGLLHCEMFSTARGMLENFLYIVNIYGYIPNGGRIYYAGRSQPPLLIPAMKMYHEFTNETNFIKENLYILDKEFQYWMKYHLAQVEIDGVKYRLAVYGDQSTGPRPESYREDVDSAKIFDTVDQKESHYSELKAAAESGWDFSSRWFIANATNKGNLTNLASRSILPVDLNAIIYGNAIILSEFYSMVKDDKKASHYKAIAADWKKAVTKVMWDDEHGAWFDYDLLNKQKRYYFYPTNISPLWTKCYYKNKKELVVRKVRQYLQENKIMNFQGGVPATNEHTGEQWDFPNAWPPLQHIIIEGLEATGDSYAQRAAFELCTTWVRSNYKAFQETEAMFEKYDSTVLGGYGTGGEYEIQLGFGWTNGVILDLLYKYGDRLSETGEVTEAVPKFHIKEDAELASDTGFTTTNTFSQVVTGLLALLNSLTAEFIGVANYKRRTYGSVALENCLKNTVQYTELKNIAKRDKTIR